MWRRSLSPLHEVPTIKESEIITQGVAAEAKVGESNDVLLDPIIQDLTAGTTEEAYKAFERSTARDDLIDAVIEKCPEGRETALISLCYTLVIKKKLDAEVVLASLTPLRERMQHSPDVDRSVREFIIGNAKGPGFYSNLKKRLKI